MKKKKKIGMTLFLLDTSVRLGKLAIDIYILYMHSVYIYYIVHIIYTRGGQTVDRG